MVELNSKLGMVYLHGLGHFHPDNVIDNVFLESLEMGTTDQWIMERVGIKSRRTVLPLDYIRKTRNQDVREASKVAEYCNGETAKRAALMALKNAGITADKIGMIIAGGCSPDTVAPAESSRIAKELGLNQAVCVDLNAACSSFGAQIYWLSLMRSEALPEFILLVSPENNTRTVDYRDRSTAVLWGDGTSATIVSTRTRSRAEVVSTQLRSDSNGWDKVLIPRVGHFSQQGSAVQAFAIRKMVECYKEIKNRYPEPSRKIFFIGHQANLRILESVCDRCHIPPECHFYNVDTFGNTGAAGAPVVLSQNWERFQTGDVVALIVVGAGLTWASMTIEFH